MTIGGATPRTNRGQYHTRKPKRIRRGVFFGWYTVDPDVLLLPLPYHPRVAVAFYRDVPRKVPIGPSLIH